MASTSTGETTPLLPQHHQHPASSNTSPSPTPKGNRPPRTVTFNPLATVSTYHDAASADPTFRPLHSNASSFPSSSDGQRPTGLSALNSKLRRRNSHGSPYSAAPMAAAPKVGPQRTTKKAQKLKLLPDPVTAAEEAVEGDFPSDVYSQIARIKEPAARSHAARLGKADRDRLPRVTAYCTANSYRLDGVIKFLKSRANTRGANPKLYDECVYSPYDYEYEEKKAGYRSASDDNLGTVSGPPPERPSGERRYSDSAVEIDDSAKARREDLIDLQDAEFPSELAHTPENAISASHVAETPDFDTTIHTPEVFLFDYGTVVIWGMSPAQESRFLSDISKFATSILSPEDTQIENFNFYYAREYQARIYNDFISLRDPKSNMIKLAISHALAQSVKTSLFEDLVSETISNTAPLPAQIAQTGSVNLTRRQINMQIGELFILRINIHLQGSVLDSPELMWAEPQLEPVYQAVRSYLEMDQRVSLLTERLDVIADLLAVLKEQLTHRHGEYLEWIVIVLIAAEILVAAINIVVDLYAGVD
ncbi:YagE family protein [Aspergillus melleus]|uniref:YagE family protein n=1 Tax=Aspergillus melleus TaxID=138277 RepID=UPI001E8D1FE1|nr:sporulation protein rmd1 [Aspergillus melleus]KAH8424710.1 sporulation protein rmd1 [Aspergillus melleus]